MQLLLGTALCWGFESHFRSDQTSSDCCKRRKKITYSRVIMPKQVGLIIPRGPFLNLEWFVGSLGGGGVTGFTPSWPLACTYSQLSTANAHTHSSTYTEMWLHVPIVMHKQTHKQMAVKEGLRPSWARQLSHTSVSANMALSHIPLRQPQKCVCVCKWECQSVCLSLASLSVSVNGV